MKKFIVLGILILVAGLAGLLVMSGTLPLYATGKGEVRRLTEGFWEAIQFKDFDAAAEYDKDEDKESVAKGIERMFRVKPENLDIQTVEVLYVEIDSSGERARSKARLTGEMLNPKHERIIEAMLFWELTGEKWQLRLKSSLK